MKVRCRVDILGPVRLSAWWISVVTAVAALVVAARPVVAPGDYRIDVDVYRQGAQTWLDGLQLYGDVEFLTQFPDFYLPFTYPPIAAVLFSPMAWMSLETATTVMSVLSVVLLVVSTTIVLAGLDVWRCAARGFGPAWFRRTVLATIVVAVLLWLDLEPISNNFACGQINVVLMTLVLADCVPRTTPWPRGLLLGVAIAVKLTPAVFLLFLVLRRDWRATCVALGTFAASVVLGFALAPRDSWEYWTATLRHTERIGEVARDTNQNLAGLLARFGLTDSVHTAVWLATCLAALALTVWAARRALLADEPILGLVCVAMMALLVSPVSWSHHWVWAVPTFVVATVVGVRRRSAALVVVTLAGLAVMYWSPVKDVLVEGGWLNRAVSSAYVWWAVAFLGTVGVITRRPSPVSAPAPGTPEEQPCRP